MTSGKFKPLPDRDDVAAGDSLPEEFTQGVVDNFEALASTDALSGSSMIGVELSAINISPSGNDVTAWLEAIDNGFASSLPSGLISPYGGSSAPTGYLMCDGSSKDSVADITLTDLFAIIGTTYGGTGADDFNLPDLQGKIPVGKDGATFTSEGDIGGEEEHTLIASEMPSHTHFPRYTSGAGTTRGAARVGTGDPGTEINHNVTTSSAGSDVAHNNLQPYLVVNYIIKK